MKPGIKVVDSAVATAYPRSGGDANLGKDGIGAAPAPAQVAPAKGKELKIVVVYAPWCGWSKKSLPDFKKMEGSLNNLPPVQTNGWKVSVELYNSEEPAGKAKAKELGVKGFPSVVMFVDGKRMDGPREHSKMAEVINETTGGKVQA
jgi:thiol-disulfide isomerase/thioredoxin